MKGRQRLKPDSPAVLRLKAPNAGGRFCRGNLLGVGQSEGETRFFTVRGRAMDDAGFGGFVEGRRDALQSFGSFLFLAGPEKLQVGAFKGVKAGFDAAVMQLFACTIAHPAFC